MNYVIDIDDTICIPGSTEDTKYTDATPIQNRIDKINKLYDDGNRIIYLTARGMGKFKNNASLAHKEYYQYTVDQLTSWGCKFHEVYLGKPSGDYYIDDKGINSNDFFRN
jgi:hypothetical protein|tara:strand:- start:176 stop:505 length:330 start_codon:yes stop_codon:yes gene_type:complete